MVQTLEKWLRRDRTIAVAGLATVSLLAWLYIVQLRMGAHAATAPLSHATMPMSIHGSGGWNAVDAGFALLMWAVMMVAMMTPSAAPLILTFLPVARRVGTGSPLGAAVRLLLGYLSVWLFFSAGAVLLQWSLRASGLFENAGMRATPVVSGIILLAAGGYQFTRLKASCLSHCRSPLDFLTTHWHRGPLGEFVMGLRHGIYCLGCCWSLMLVLFAVGVMNLVSVAALAALVLVERVLPQGRYVSYTTGIFLLALGIWTVAGGLLLLAG